MKNAALVIALSGLFALVAVPVASAMACSLSGDHVCWGDHHDPADARIAITTEDGKVTLLLTDREVALQLSERTLHKVRRELKNKREEQDNPLGAAIATAVISTVRELIDNSFECRVRHLRDVSYEDGRLVLTGRNGKPVFEDADLCDTDVMASFLEEDARRFVREFRKLKAERY